MEVKQYFLLAFTGNKSFRKILCLCDDVSLFLQQLLRETYFYYIWVRITKMHSGLCTRVSNGTGQRNFSGQRDSQNFFVPGQRDNGTEVPSLSRDKGTTGQAQNLAKGRDGPGQPKPGTGRAGTAKIRDGTRDKTGQSRKGCSKTV